MWGTSAAPREASASSTTPLHGAVSAVVAKLQHKEYVLSRNLGKFHQSKLRWLHIVRRFARQEQVAWLGWVNLAAGEALSSSAWPAMIILLSFISHHATLITTIKLLLKTMLCAALVLHPLLRLPWCMDLHYLVENIHLTPALIHLYTYVFNPVQKCTILKGSDQRDLTKLNNKQWSQQICQFL